MSLPGYWNNTITGSVGEVYQYTGSDTVRFLAFSPNGAQSPTGTSGSFGLSFYSNDNIMFDGVPREGWQFGANRNVLNLAAVAVFDRVLSDGEVRTVFNYYTSSLGLEIGL